MCILYGTDTCKTLTFGLVNDDLVIISLPFPPPVLASGWVGQDQGQNQNLQEPLQSHCSVQPLSLGNTEDVKAVLVRL